MSSFGPSHMRSHACGAVPSLAWSVYRGRRSTAASPSRWSRHPRGCLTGWISAVPRTITARMAEGPRRWRGPSCMARPRLELGTPRFSVIHASCRHVACVAACPFGCSRPHPAPHGRKAVAGSVGVPPADTAASRSMPAGAELVATSHHLRRPGPRRRGLRSLLIPVAQVSPHACRWDAGEVCPTGRPACQGPRQGLDEASRRPRARRAWAAVPTWPAPSTPARGVRHRRPSAYRRRRGRPWTLVL
jgi:hypothetical protein